MLYRRKTKLATIYEDDENIIPEPEIEDDSTKTVEQ